MAYLMGDADKGADWRLLLHPGSTINSDAGSLACREVRDTLRLADTGANTLALPKAAELWPLISLGNS